MCVCMLIHSYVYFLNTSTCPGKKRVVFSQIKGEKRMEFKDTFNGA
jgi:hypothetical protein